jgi:glutamine amidotransferase
MIVVADYGMGNLRNVQRAFEKTGYQVRVTADPDVIRSAVKIVLPGVGAFGEAVKRIDGLGLREPLVAHARAGKPLLGICLGMQLLFFSSEESPGARGLELLEGEVRKFRHAPKIPHIGWNEVVPIPSAPLFAPGEGPVCCYFVHSYLVPDCAAATAFAEYGERFVSAVGTGSIYGFQFHPEKSQAAGLRMLGAFAAL